jgi:membrane protein DedA with SNARE-associated domain
MSFIGVIAAGTLGSYAGSLVSYWVARAVGAPVVERYGKYFLLSHEKLVFLETWVRRYGAGGVFFSRLLPVVRHLVSIPAGILRMNFARFSVVTTLGAGLWCAILSWFGRQVIGDRPDLLSSPEVLVQVCRERLHWFVGGVMVLAATYALVLYIKKKQPNTAVSC